jgi:hypothetical protein
VPHFQLVTTDGEALGPVELAGSDWPVGRVVELSDGRSVRVVRWLESDDDPELFEVLVVEEA